MTVLFEASRLKKSFPVDHGRRLHAVDGVDLALQTGDSLGVVGESGSGKSTLARLVAGLIAPDAGMMRFGGEDLSANSGVSPARRQGIQLVFQSAEDALNPAFSIARNIGVGLGRTLRLDVAGRDRITAIAEEVGLSREQLARRPHQLSGGQQARAGIARALVSDPRLLILDEPTASLDVSVQATVLKLIDRLRQSHNIALVFVSHDLDVVRLMCRQVLVLYLGRVAEIGPVYEVLRAPRHPYTRALVAATPGHGRTHILDGEPTSPIDPLEHACLFAGRCPLAIQQCRIERPQLRRVDGRLVACHRAEEPAAASIEFSEFAACSPR